MTNTMMMMSYFAMRDFVYVYRPTRTDVRTNEWRLYSVCCEKLPVRVCLYVTKRYW